MNFGSQRKPFSKQSPRERITHVVEGWFLTEPLLFATWTMHEVIQQPTIDTIRVKRGTIEFNPTFIKSLRKDQLRAVLSFEAIRILLGHPYDRKKPDSQLSYSASNLAVQECLRTDLPIPRARDLFQDESFDDQYFEFYYHELCRRSDTPQQTANHQPSSESTPPHPWEPTEDSDSGHDHEQDEIDDETIDGEETGESDDTSGQADDANERSPQTEPDDTESSKSGGPNLESYADPNRVGLENAMDWDNDELFQNEIDTAVREAAETEGWGSIAGSTKEKLLATLTPKLDFRSILRGFRQSVLSVDRRLTRMKPSRRYGFQQMGSRYDFSTNLLFAVDVSGSMGTEDLRRGFSIVGRFFRYGIKTIDVIWFDEVIQSDPMTLRRARRTIEITGRGGTNFQPVVDYIDQRKQYDGLIVFTDGFAAVPKRPKNRKTRILWLFKDESTFKKMNQGLADLGRSAFLRETKSE